MWRFGFLLTLFSVFSFKSIGQVKVNPNEIDHVLLSDGGGGMGGFGSTEYKVSRENGHWSTYQIRKYVQLMPRMGKASYDSVQHKFVKVIAEDSIQSLLKAINTIKPEYNPAKLGFTVERLTKQINERFFPHNPNKAKAFAAFFDTPNKLYDLLKAVQDDYMTDVGFSAAIRIIKKNGDTIKITSNNQTSLMLPWEVNNVKTFDANISRFLSYATGVDGRASEASLLGTFYNIANYRFGKEAFGFSFWMKTYPENMKFLQKYYTITELESYGAGSTFNCKLLYNNYHIVVTSYVDISNKKQLDLLAKFSTDTLKPLLDKHVFMIDSCLKSGTCKLHFTYGLGGSGKYSPTVWSNANATKVIKEAYTKGKYNFSVVDRNLTEEDQWLALPDGNFLLASYFRDIVMGVSPAYIKRDHNQNQNVALKIFSRDGKLLGDWQQHH